MAQGNELIDFSRFRSRLRVTGTLQTETALRIGSGEAGGPTEQDSPVLKDVRGRPYVPGSSFKGAFRAHLEKLLRGMDESLACLSTSRPRTGELPGCLTQEDVDAIKDRFADNPDGLAQQILARSCWTCSLLGAPWLASKALFRDLPVLPESWFGRYLVRDGVAIDRDTERAAEGLKYDFEAVPAGTAFRFEAMVENASSQELGLALLGLREFEQGRVTIGAAASRGLGAVRLDVDWDRAELVTATDLRAYMAGQVAAGLSLETRESYWATLVAALDGGQEHA